MIGGKVEKKIPRRRERRTGRGGNEKRKGGYRQREREREGGMGNIRNLGIKGYGGLEKWVVGPMRGHPPHDGTWFLWAHFAMMGTLLFVLITLFHACSFLNRKNRIKERHR